MIKWARELNKRYPPDYSGPAGVGHVIKTGLPEIYPEITDEMLAAAARDEDHLGLMRELSFKSALVVPMIARGRTLVCAPQRSAELDQRARMGEPRGRALQRRN